MTPDFDIQVVRQRSAVSLQEASERWHRMWGSYTTSADMQNAAKIVAEQACVMCNRVRLL